VNAGAELACGGTTTYTPQSDTAYAIGEAAAATTDLANYETTYSTDCTGSLPRGQNKTCTITNKPKPRVKVVKSLQPSSDAGRFDLLLNGSSKAAGVGDGGTTGFVTVAVGSNPTVGEAAAGSTNLSDYESSISCDNGASGSGSGPLSVGALTAGAQVTCTISNKRKPQVKVVKSLQPSSDAGRFDLLINGSSKADAVGDGGNTGFVNVAVGSNPTVGESGSSTDLSDYASSISCDNGASAASAGPLALGTLNAGAKVTCTITNKRRVFKIVTLVCETTGATPVLYQSNVTLGTTKSTQASGDAASLCALAANFPGLVSGTYTPSVVIAP
jgi:hypothetical protein